MDCLKDNRFVAHLDMLGMKRLTRRAPDIAWKKLSALRIACEERMTINIEQLYLKEMISNQVRYYTFSDTVIAFSKGEGENDALAILILTTELFMRALYYGVPVRVGIAHGRFDFNLDLNLFSGPALVDAYEIGECSQWLGIVLDDHTAEAFSKLPVSISHRGNAVIVPWDVRWKDGSVHRKMVVNWPETHYKEFVGPFPATIEAFYQPFEELFGPLENLDPSSKVKYDHAFTFFNAHHHL